MKIATEVVWQMTESGMEEVSRVEYEYRGPLDLCGGGPAPEQRAAAASQAALSTKLGDVADKNQQFVERQQAKSEPFYTSRMNEGLPYYNAATDQAGGITARAFQPARAALAKRLSSFGTSLPSGFADASYRDLDTAQAHQYDDNLMAILDANERAKQAGASGTMGQAELSNPLGYYQGSMQGKQSILQAPLQRPGLAGLVGGAIGGASSAFFG